MTTKVSHAHAHAALVSAFRNAGLREDQTHVLIKALDHYVAAGFDHVADEEKAEDAAAKEKAKVEAAVLKEQLKAEKEHAKHA